jgi:phage gp46-like protein
MADAKEDAVLNTTPLGDEVLYDFKIDDSGDIETEDQLDTAILVSLFTDRRANSAQIVKPQARRGWVGDLETPEDLYGSMLWLFEQSRLTAVVASKIGSFGQACLQWMLRDSIATEVSARAIVRAQRVDLKIDIKKPNSPAEAHVFALWENSGRG